METSTSQSGKSDNIDKVDSTNLVEATKKISEMSAEKIQGIVEIEKLRAQSEAVNLAFNERQLTADVEMAKLQLSLHAEIEQKRDRETRKNIITVSAGALLLLIIIMAFMAWCLLIDKEQFVIDLIKYSLYPLSAGGGYWAGRSSSQKSDRD